MRIFFSTAVLAMGIAGAPQVLAQRCDAEAQRLYQRAMQADSQARLEDARAKIRQILDDVKVYLQEAGVDVATRDKYFPYVLNLDYYFNNKNSNGYCRFVIEPKLKKLKLKH